MVDERGITLLLAIVVLGLSAAWLLLSFWLLWRRPRACAVAWLFGYGTAAALLAAM